MADQNVQTTNVLADLVANARNSYAKGKVSEARADVDQFLNTVRLEALTRMVALDKEVADFCRQQGDAEYAEIILKHAVVLAEADTSPEHLQMVVALANLAAFYLKNGQTAAALHQTGNVS